VAQQPLGIEGETRENFLITEASTNHQFRFVMPGPLLKEAEWAQFLHELERLEPVPKYLVASGSLPPGVPPDFYAWVIRLGKERGIRVLLDTSGEPLRRAAAEGAFLLKPNLRELETLADSGLNGEEELHRAACDLVEQRENQAVVLSLGAAGALLVTPQQHLRLPAPSVHIQSRVGAGDSMMAGMVLKLAQGWAIEEAVRYGVAAGTAAVMNPGTELCRPEDTQRLYRQHLASQAMQP